MAATAPTTPSAAGSATADAAVPRLVVVVTASTGKQAAAIERELAWRVDWGVLPQGTLVYAVADPEGARVGSGGATLNALVTVADLLSAQYVCMSSMLCPP